MGRLFTLITIFILSSEFILAQQNIIDHPIKKGETVYIISKKYGVSMNAIFQLNPGSEDIIYAGRTLKIPSSSNTTTNNTSVSENIISNYEVQRGETKSGLARRFGVSITMLEQQNPHIIRMLQAGHIINIDKSIREEERNVNEGEHRVIKGETLWGISRRYGVSLDQLTAVNADQLSEFLQIGQVLTIPDKDTVVQNTGEYIVKRGDTKFELARRFNMTIEELEQSNPHIIDMLMAGHKIDITKTNNDNTQNTIAEVDNDDTNPSTTETDPITDDSEPTETIVQSTDSIPNTNQSNDSKYIDYIIKPKETLFSLSQKAGMTIDDFTSLNPKLSFAVNAGDVIKMPAEAIEDSIAVNENDTSTTEEPNENSDTEVNTNTSLYANLDTVKTNGLYFYTPFSSDELRSTELREDMVKSNTEYQKFIDFFQGAQIAIDSAKVLSLNFEITLIKSDNVRQQLNIESPYKDNALLIPFVDDSNNYPDVKSDQSISIVDIESNPNLIEDHTLIHSIPSKEIQKQKTLDYISNQDAEVLVVTDLDEAKNKGLIQKTLPNAKFLKVDNAGFFKDDNLQQVLDPNKLNYVILDSDKTIVFLNTTTALMNQLADYDIQLVLIESSLIPKQNQVSNMRYRILKLIFPAIFHNSGNNKQETDFETIYKDLYEVKPTKSAILGFNVTLDILLRLSQKTSFENTINTIVSEHSHLKFDYKKTSEKTYSNTSLYLMQYDSNDGIIVLKNR